MKGLVNYREIAGWPMPQVLDYIVNQPKLVYGELTYASLKINDLPTSFIYEPDWEKQVFGHGVYIFFNGKEPVYVGIADNNFKHRFQSHRHFDGRPEWAFNKLARFTAEHLLGNKDLAMDKTSFYQQVLPRMDKLEVYRISFLDTPYLKKNLMRCESLLRFGYNATTWNGIGKTRGYNPDLTLQNLMQK